MARVVKGRVKEPVFRSPLITKIEGAKGEDSHKLSQCNQHLQQQGSVQPVCKVCGKGHSGQSRYSSIVCYHCGQAGHISWNCPRKGAQQLAAPAPQPTVQVERLAGRGAGRGRAQGRAPAQTQAQAPASVGRGHGRVFAVNQQKAQTTNTAVTGIS